MNFRGNIAGLLIALGPLTPICAQSSTAAHGASTITIDDLRRHMYVIAHDSMMGRDTPSRGLDLTAAYIAGQFKSFGLTPGGDSGTFVQHYPLKRPTGAGGATAAAAVTAPNVVGILEGSDPVLKHEYIVFSAHMDHVGIQPGTSGDSIYNGADDDASGTVGIIALAKAFSSARPKRSLIFLTVSGEEAGLWGSAWFAARPPVPIKQIVANLNMDMIGRNWKDTIVVIGKEHSDLGQTLDRVNAAHPELSMKAIDDLWPQENFYYRSDHFNFARRGVPVLFFFNGTHADYHEVSDEPSKIDFEKQSRVIKMVYYLGYEVGNAAKRPQWNPESYKRIVDGKK